MNAEERHLSPESFATYLHAGVPIEHPVAGAPRLILFFDPHRVRIGLRGPARPDERQTATGLENVTVHTVHHNQQRLTEIAVTDTAIFTDAYPLLCLVADRVQLDGRSLTDALMETLRRLGHLLRRENTLSEEAETGLFGELLLLNGLAHAGGPALALGAWHGGQSEEHDFGLSEYDVEVKTTTSERRSHWISSLTQLVPTGRRALWLVSMQVTRAGSGGTTLGDLVARLRATFERTDESGALDDRLRSAGWRDRYGVGPQQRWRSRSHPAVFAVTAGFPRLTPHLLTAASVDPAYVTDVRYRIDLTGRPTDECSTLLADALSRGDQDS